MKKILIHLASLLLASSLFAANAAVQVNSTNGIVTYPMNFFTVNGVQTTGGVAAIDARVTTLETELPATSNALSGRIDTAANATRVLSDRMTVLSTNTATLAMGVLGTNAYGKINAALASFPYTNVSFGTTGNVTALHFVGDGS